MTVCEDGSFHHQEEAICDLELLWGVLIWLQGGDFLGGGNVVQELVEHVVVHNLVVDGENLLAEILERDLNHPKHDSWVEENKFISRKEERKEKGKKQEKE